MAFSPFDSHKDAQAARALLCLALAVSVYGCRSAVLPELDEYAKATGTLQTSTLAAFHAADASLGDVQQLAQGSQREEIGRQRASLRESTRVRAEVLGALVSYTDRLDGIAESARSQQAKADEVRDAVKSLIDSVGSLTGNPINPVAGAVGSGAKAAADAIAAFEKYRIARQAARNMADAIAEFNSVVQKAAEAIRLDLGDLREQFLSNRLELQSLTEERHEEVYNTIDLVKKQRREELAKLNVPTTEPATAPTTHSATTPTTEPATAPTTNPVRVLDTDLRANLQAYSELIDWLSSISGAATASAAAERADAGAALVVAAQEAVAAWAQAHADLGEALRESRGPSLTALAEAVKQLATLTDEVRKSGKAIREAQRNAEK